MIEYYYNFRQIDNFPSELYYEAVEEWIPKEQTVSPKPTVASIAPAAFNTGDTMSPKLANSKHDFNQRETLDNNMACVFPSPSELSVLSDGYSQVMEQKIKKGTIPEWKKRASIPEDLQGGSIDLDRLTVAGKGADLSGYISVEDSVKHTQKTAEMVSSLRGQLKVQRTKEEGSTDDERLGPH